MTVSDCEFEMSEYEYEMSVYGMTRISLTRATMVWHEWDIFDKNGCDTSHSCMRKYDKSECNYEWHKVIHFMYKIWSVTIF